MPCLVCFGPEHQMEPLINHSLLSHLLAFRMFPSCYVNITDIRNETNKKKKGIKSASYICNLQFNYFRQIWKQSWLSTYIFLTEQTWACQAHADSSQNMALQRLSYSESARLWPAATSKNIVQILLRGR